MYSSCIFPIRLMVRCFCGCRAHFLGGSADALIKIRVGFQRNCAAVQYDTRIAGFGEDIRQAIHQQVLRLPGHCSKTSDRFSARCRRSAVCQSMPAASGNSDGSGLQRDRFRLPVYCLDIVINEAFRRQIDMPVCMQDVEPGAVVDVSQKVIRIRFGESCVVRFRRSRRVGCTARR